MPEEPRAALENNLRQRFDRGDLHGACTAALEGYGPEILGLLLALTRHDDDAAEIFAAFSEDLWRGLPHFRWASSLRTWAYTLARNAHQRYQRDPTRRRAHRAVPPEDCEDILRVADQVRTRTQLHLRSSVHRRVDVLRAQLDPDDQLLLTLRIDKKLPWLDIARILHDAPEPLDDAAAARRANALRQRLHHLKQRLRALAVAEGLLDPG